MNRTSVMQWVAGYERVWREGDLAGVTRLFTEGARYRRSPYWPGKPYTAEDQTGT